MKRYNDLNTFLREKFGERVLKICIDGGFTCPNRDGKVSKGGCIFCSSRGSGEHINGKNSIKEQVQEYLSSEKVKRANKFIAYFQNFTNTYDTLENLKKKYDSALIDEKVVALAVATRPDAIDENIAMLLKSYADKYYVFVELGLQTSSDDIAKVINRGYESKVFTKAVNILNKYNIDVVVHVMVGLPYETQDDIINTVKFLNKHNIQGIKIHSCYITKGTVLEDMYKKGIYTPLELNSYIESAVYILTHIDSNVIIHKLSGDAPKDLLVAPSWNTHKKWILNGIVKKMNSENLFQGMYYNEI